MMFVTTHLDVLLLIIFKCHLGQLTLLVGFELIIHNIGLTYYLVPSEVSNHIWRNLCENFILLHDEPKIRLLLFKYEFLGRTHTLLPILEDGFSYLLDHVRCSEIRLEEGGAKNDVQGGVIDILLHREYGAPNSVAAGIEINIEPSLLNDRFPYTSSRIITTHPKWECEGYSLEYIIPVE